MNLNFIKMATNWDDSKHRIIVATTWENETVGCVCLRYNKGQESQKKRVQIWNLFVSPQHQKKGVGKELLQMALEDASKVADVAVLEWCAKDSAGWVLDWFKRKGFEIKCASAASTLLMEKILWYRMKPIANNEQKQ